MPRGGYHPHAERWGRKSAWNNDSATKTIRVPEALAEQVLDLAHKLDEGKTLASDTEAKVEVNEAGLLKAELAALQEEARVWQQKALEADTLIPGLEDEIQLLREEVEYLKSQQPDLEAERDRALALLKLGKQAPEYKRAKKYMDLLIAELKSKQPIKIHVLRDRLLKQESSGPQSQSFPSSATTLF